MVHFMHEHGIRINYMINICLERTHALLNSSSPQPTFPLFLLTNKKLILIYVGCSINARHVRDKNNLVYDILLMIFNFFSSFKFFSFRYFFYIRHFGKPQKSFFLVAWTLRPYPPPTPLELSSHRNIFSFSQK